MAGLKKNVSTEYAWGALLDPYVIMVLLSNWNCILVYQNNGHELISQLPPTD